MGGARLMVLKNRIKSHIEHPQMKLTLTFKVILFQLRHVYIAKFVGSVFEIIVFKMKYD